MGTIISNLKLTANMERGGAGYGAYSIVGRLNDIPLTLDGVSQPDLAAYKPRLPMPPEGLRPGQVNTSYPTAWIYNSPYDHGGIPKKGSITVEERDRLAKIGVDYINEVVDKMDAPALIRAIKDHQKYMQEVSKKYGDLLPK